MNDISTIILAAASIIGALFSASLGWLDSGEPFNPRKFGASILRTIIAGIIIVGGYSTLPSATIFDYFLAFLAGAGIEVYGNRLAGAIASRSQPAAPTPTATT